MTEGVPIVVPPGTGVDGDTGWQEVQVRTEILHDSAKELELIEDDLPKSVTAGLRDFDEAALKMDGFASKAALAEVLEQWEFKTGRLLERCEGLRVGLTNAANAYAFVDGNNDVGLSTAGTLVEPNSAKDEE